MLEFRGSAKAFTCDGATRRDFLRVGTLGMMGLSLPDYLAAKEQGRVRDDADDRSCIMIFNLGAPSQLDTFDMKPDAPAEIRGPFRPIRTASPEIRNFRDSSPPRGGCRSLLAGQELLPYLGRRA